MAKKTKQTKQPNGFYNKLITNETHKKKAGNTDVYTHTRVCISDEVVCSVMRSDYLYKYIVCI